MSPQSQDVSVTSIHKAPLAQASGQPSAAVTAELMQEYQRVTQATASAGFSAVPTADGDMELYTVDDNGDVWRTTPDPDSDTGWSTADLQFPGGQVAAIAGVLGPNNTTYLFASTSAMTGLQRWDSTSGQWQCVNQTFPGGASTTLTSLTASCVGSQVHLATLGAAGDLYWQSGMQSAPGTPLRVGQQYGSVTLCCFGQYAPNSGGNQPLLFFASSSSVYVAYMAPGIQIIPVAPISGVSSMATAFSAVSQGPLLFVVVASQVRCYQPTPQGLRGSPWWATTILFNANYQPLNASICTIAAMADGAGVPHVLATDIDGYLFHTSFTISPTQSGSHSWSPAVPLVCACNLAQGVTSNKGAVGLFAIVDGTCVVQGLMDPASGIWRIDPLTVDIPGQDWIEQVTAYSATFTAYGPDGNISPCLGITIGCANLARMSVNGRTTLVGPNNPWSGNVGPNGQLTVTFVTDSLGVPSPYVVLAGMDPNNPLALDLSRLVRDTLSEVTSGGLAAATSAAGYQLDYSEAPLLTNPTQEQLDTLSQSITQVMDLAQTSGDLEGPNIHPRSRRGLLRQLGTWDLSVPPNKIDATALPERYFVIDLSKKGDPRFIPHTAESMGVWRAQALRRPGPAGDGGSIWETFGDFISGVFDDVIEGVQVAISSVAGVITATVQFTMDGIEAVWEVVVGAVEELVDLVEAVFAAVAVEFADLVGWLGWIFNWQDILNTGQLLSGVFQNVLPWITASAPTIQSAIDAQIAQAQSQLSSVIQYYVNKLPANATFGSLLGLSPEPAANAAPGTDPRNVFLRGIQSSGSTASTPMPQPSQTEGAGASTVAAETQTLSQSTAATNLLNQAQQSLSPSTSFLDIPLASVAQTVQGAISAALGAVQGQVDTVFGAVEESVGLVNDFLGQTWDIPFVTDLYAWITNGTQLTPINALGLILAIPTTITYKAMFNDSPAPDSATVAAMLAAIPQPNTLLDAAVSDDDSDTKLRLWRVGAIAQGAAYGVLSLLEPIVDFNIAITALAAQSQAVFPPATQPNNQQWATKLGLAPKVIFVMTELFAFGMAGLNTVAITPAVNCSSAKAKKNIVWVLDGIAGVLDLATLVSDYTAPQLLREKVNANGSIVASLYGVGQCVAYGIAASQDTEMDFPDYAEFCLLVPRMLKFLIHPRLNTGSWPWGALAEVLIDATGNFCAATLWFTAAAYPPSVITGQLGSEGSEAIAAAES